MSKFAKFLLRILLIFCCVLFTLQLHGQGWKTLADDLSVNFYEVCAQAEKHFDTIDVEVKGSGYKGYQRWKYDNEYKFYPDGNRNNIDPYFVRNQYEKFLLNRPTLIQPSLPSATTTTTTTTTSGWQELGPTSPGQITGHYSFGMGRVVCFYVDPSNAQRLYIGSRTGGFWSSNDGGTTWSGGSTDFLPACGVRSITASPTNSDSVLISLSSGINQISYGIYFSSDGGESWEESDFNPTNLGWGGLGSNGRIYTVRYHPTIPDLVFIGTNQGLFRSEDHLETWDIKVANYDFPEINFHPTDPSMVYAFTKDTPNDIYVSSDTGSTFTLTPLPNGNGGSGRIEVSADCADCVYFMSSHGIWKSVDKGSSFVHVSTPGLSRTGFAVSDIDTSKMIAGYVDAHASSDGGSTFEKVTHWSLGSTNGAGSGDQISFNTSTDYIHADIQYAGSVGGVFYAVTDGFLVSSEDFGTNWNILSKDIGIRMNYNLGVSQSNNSRTICGSQDNGTSINTEDGWVEMYGADGMEGIIHPLNDDWMIGSVQYGHRVRTFNAGQNSSSFTAGEGGDWIAPMFYDPNNHMQLYSMSKSVFRSPDFGDTWINMGTPSFTGEIDYGSIAENNSAILVATKSRHIELSVDSGATWTNIQNNLPNHHIKDVVFDPNDDSTLMVVYGRYQDDNSKVFVSHNLGANWTNVTYNLGSIPAHSVAIDFSENSTIYLGTEIGLYKKAMSDTIWTLYNTDLPNVAIRELEIMWGSNTLRASTWGRGLWEFELDGKGDYPKILTTKITDLPTSLLPKETIGQYVNSTITYDGALSDVYVDWSVDTPSFGLNTIPMSNIGGDEWESNSPLPDYPEGTLVYFKVFAVGTAGDTTETYKYMYTIKPYDYCGASGKSFYLLYISNVNVSNLNKTSQNDGYSYSDSDVVELRVGETYDINVTGTTGWSSNDYAAWIDYDGDLNFSSDEAVVYALNNGWSATDSFTVPSTAIIGDTLRMRVRMGYWYSWEINSCDTALGEVEDYPVIILPPCEPYTIIDTQITCGPYTWINGVTYTTSVNNVTDTLTNINGCDSVVSLNLTVNSPSSSTDNQTECDSYTWINGITYTSSNNTASHTILNSSGCDSTISLNLTILPESNSTDFHEKCESYTWIDGVTYTSSNTSATHTLMNMHGCDSVVSLELIINPIFETTDSQSACESFTWINGVTYVESNNTASHTLQSSKGCDSIVSLDLTIDNLNESILINSSTLEAVSAIGTYQWIDCNNDYSLIHGETNQVFAPAVNGVYAVIVTNGSCSDTSDCAKIATIGLDDLTPEEKGIVIYPNPSYDGMFFILFDGEIEKIEIFDVTGRLIHSPSYSDNEINCSNLQPGQYLIKIKTHNEAFFEEIIVIE